MESLDQFFKDNDRGYPRDPRRMAYAKLRKNIQGMNREELEAFINANLSIPHSQYKMALGNLIKFLQKQDQMNQLNEVRQFQKIAGLLKEDDYSEDPSSDMDDESQSGDTSVMDVSEGESVGEKVSIPTKTVKGLDGKTYNLITLYQNTRNGLSGQTYSLDKPYTFTGVVDQENEQYQNVKLDPGYENIEADIFIKQPKNGQHLLGSAQKLANIYQIHKGFTTFRKY